MSIHGLAIKLSNSLISGKCPVLSYHGLLRLCRQVDRMAVNNLFSVTLIPHSNHPLNCSIISLKWTILLCYNLPQPAITVEPLRIIDARAHSFPCRISDDLHGPLWHCHVQRVQNNIRILLWSIVFAGPSHAHRLLTTRGHGRGLRHELPSSTGYVHPVRLCRRTAAVRGCRIVLNAHRLRGGWSRRRGSCRCGGRSSFRVRVHLFEFP